MTKKPSQLNSKNSNTKRKGAKRISEIPHDILHELLHGRIETANLVEWLAVNPFMLLHNFLSEVGRTHLLQQFSHVQPKGINHKHQWIGQWLADYISQSKDTELWLIAKHHTSDIVRAWAAYIVGYLESLSLEERLSEIKYFAVDEHFAVREAAWMAIRTPITHNIDNSLELLTTWVTSDHPYTRRFAIEVTRPCGVWCKHIHELKQQPQKALPLLQPLYQEPERYVQNSVANWLNDAAKYQPHFVIDLCKQWLQLSSMPHTLYIVKRAIRSLPEELHNISL